jgi:heat shock protein HslJ
MAMLLVLGGVLLTACGGTSTDKLTATTWYLVSGGEKNPSWQWTVPLEAQSRYTIRFEADGKFTSQADCNQLAGSWQARGSDRVTITPGPMTMAFCGEMSFDILYASTLRQVQGWTVASTGMSLNLADGGRLDYTSVAPPSPSPSAEPTVEPTVTSTPTPAPTATTTATVTAAPTATATVTVRPTPSASTTRPTPPPTATPPPKPPTTAPPKPTPTTTPTPGPGLTSRAWQLAAFTLKVPAFEGAVPQDQQARYTIQFRTDGTFTAQADCNTVNGTYSPANPAGSSGSLSLVPGPVTVVACEEGSYGDLYITGIANAASFAIEGENLTLTLVDSGRLEYR